MTEPGAQPLRPMPARPGRGAERARLHEMLRVDQAGEVAAVQIYRAQAAVFAASPATADLAARMTAMGEQEARHLAAFDEMLTARQVRPSLLAPVWRAAAFALGTGTALLGEKAAHACTDAVEQVIEAHYARQALELQTSEPELAAELTRFREEELAHQAEAVQAGAREAPGYGLLSAAIRAGCRAAIMTAEKL